MYLVVILSHECHFIDIKAKLIQLERFSEWKNKTKLFEQMYAYLSPDFNVSMYENWYLTNVLSNVETGCGILTW